MVVLLASIIIGVVFGIVAARKGLYSTWALLVNICVSIYLAVFLTPTVLYNIGSLADAPYALPACLAIIAVAVFAILQSIAVIFFTGQFHFSFPKILNILGAGLLGFVSGFVVCGFLGFVILTMPVLQQDSAFAGQLTEAAELSVVKVCNCINFLSRQTGRYRAKDVIEWCVGDEPAERRDSEPEDETEPEFSEDYEEVGL